MRLVCISNIVVRDLSNLVTPDDLVTSDHLITLTYVVPKCPDPPRAYLRTMSMLSILSLCSAAILTIILPRHEKEGFNFQERATYSQQPGSRFIYMLEDLKAYAHLSRCGNFCSLRNGLNMGNVLLIVLSPSVKGEKEVRSILTFSKTDDDGNMGSFIPMSHSCDGAC
ncbi:V-type proton ATPase subunit C-like [Rutidosis leptorrhynchoides]|uniref:V-type proton ATPase subunit C-like n=1 Tax=Rutidosis leptorrhynchoides TaxID=125765 RepID=UPI003A9A0E20